MILKINYDPVELKQLRAEHSIGLADAKKIVWKREMKKLAAWEDPNLQFMLNEIIDKL